MRVARTGEPSVRACSAQPARTLHLGTCLPGSVSTQPGNFFFPWDLRTESAVLPRLKGPHRSSQAVGTAAGPLYGQVRTGRPHCGSLRPAELSVWPGERKICPALGQPLLPTHPTLTRPQRQLAVSAASWTKPGRRHPAAAAAAVVPAPPPAAPGRWPSPGAPASGCSPTGSRNRGPHPASS